MLALGMELKANIIAGRTGEKVVHDLMRQAIDQGFEIEVGLIKTVFRDEVTFVATGEPEKIVAFQAWLQEYIEATRKLLHRQQNDHFLSLSWWKGILG